jgi:uncharacterized caspase-like protein
MIKSLRRIVQLNILYSHIAGLPFISYTHFQKGSILMALTWINLPYRALIVGINEYDAPKTLIPALHGCVADAHAMYDFLTQELGMAKEDILLLTSPAPDGSHTPTRANLWQGLHDFLGTVPPNSEVLFYYSGHGSEAFLDSQIAFGDKKGEALVPKDARTNNVLDILDRELWGIRAQWAERNIRLTAIMDSCFSGDVFRGDPKNPEALPMARLAGPANTARTLATLTTVEGQPQRLETLKTLYEENQIGYPFQTFIAGCRSNQLSWEVLSAQGQKRGVMTTALLDALRAVGAPITYSELAQLLPAFVTAKQLEKQEPNISGDGERGIFGTVVPPREKPLFAIHSVNADDTLEIRSGLIAGLEPDSIIEGYTDWSLTTVTGKWKVMEATAKRAKAQRLEGTAIPQVGQPLKLITRSDSPTVYFHPSAQKIQAAWYEDKKVGVPALIETTDETKAQYLVTTDRSDFVARRSDGLIRPTLRKAQQDPRAIYELARQLNRVAAYETFVARQPTPNDAWDLPINQADGLFLKVEQLDWHGNATALHPDGAGQLPARARFRVTLENQTASEMWVALYLLDEPYFVAERLYPNDNNFHLLGGASRAVTWTNNEWQGGLLSLKLFVSSQPINPTDAQKFPCGTRDTNRGSEGQRGFFVVRNAEWEDNGGWATHLITLGL